MVCWTPAHSNPMWSCNIILAMYPDHVLVSLYGTIECIVTKWPRWPSKVLFPLYVYTVFCWNVMEHALHGTNSLLFIIHMLMCTWPPCSLQSLSRDLLNKMSTSLAQNIKMMKLDLQGYNLTQVEDVKLFMHYLLLGLSSNTTLTDLTLDVPRRCWDRLQGELHQWYCFEVNCNVIGNSY